MTTLNEENSVSKKRGKWSIAGVPHKGWTCVDIEDLGEPSAECGMCESQKIRYIHHMEHTHYPDVLKVGCVCAGHMEGDLAASFSREASMKNRSSKRKRWLSRVWKTTLKGHSHLKSDGYRVTIYPKGNGWGGTVAAVDKSYLRHSKRTFKTRDEARLAAFDHISKLLSRGL